jgi:hypothetical protein
MILRGLKPIIFDRLKSYVGKGIKEFSSVLWAHDPKSCHEPHTISLVYVSEAMLLAEVEPKSF